MIIRNAVFSDAAEIARLTQQLGYPADAGTIFGRLSQLTDSPAQLVLVAVNESKIAGWLQASVSVALESGHRVEIVGLVVSEASRRQGIGRLLIQHAEKWAATIGAPTLLVRSNLKRVESHLFYPSLGFVPSKNQTVYRKSVSGKNSEMASPDNSLRAAPQLS